MCSEHIILTTFLFIYVDCVLSLADLIHFFVQIYCFVYYFKNWGKLCISR